MSYLDLAKKIQAGLKSITAHREAESVGDGTSRPDGVVGDEASVVDQIIDNGELVAVLICSKILEAHIWFALNDDWKPDPCDKTPVFYASELPFLRTKTVETLREIFKVKIKFGGGLVGQ
jgi:hypothetical protein